MSKTIVSCYQCGTEFLTETPGRKLGGIYIEIGYTDLAAASDLREACELVNAASADLPFRPELAEAADLLNRIRAQLMTVADEER